MALLDKKLMFTQLKCWLMLRCYKLCYVFLMQISPW